MPTLTFKKKAATDAVRKGAMGGLVKAATFLIRDIRKAINVSYPPASSAGEYPHKRSGNLRAEIDYWEDADLLAVEVGATEDAQYWSDLEYGTKHMEPRPFLRPRAAALERELEAIVGSSVKVSMGGS